MLGKYESSNNGVGLQTAHIHHVIERLQLGENPKDVWFSASKFCHRTNANRLHFLPVIDYFSQ